MTPPSSIGTNSLYCPGVIELALPTVIEAGKKWGKKWGTPPYENGGHLPIFRELRSSIKRLDLP